MSIWRLFPCFFCHQTFYNLFNYDMTEKKAFGIASRVKKSKHGIIISLSNLHPVINCVLYFFFIHTLNNRTNKKLKQSTAKKHPFLSAFLIQFFIRPKKRSELKLINNQLSVKFTQSNWNILELT